MAGNDAPGLLQKYLLLSAAALDGRLARSHIGVLAVILDHCIDKAYSWPGPAKISKKAMLDRRTVRRCLTDLETLGFIGIERPGERQNNIYRPNFANVPTGEIAPTGEMTPTGARVQPYGSKRPGGTGDPVRGVRVKSPSEAVALSSFLNPENKAIGAIFSVRQSEDQRQSLPNSEPRALIETMLHEEPTAEARAAALESQQVADRKKYEELVAMYGLEHGLVRSFRGHRPFLDFPSPAAAAGAAVASSVPLPAPAAAPTTTEVE